MIGWRGGCDRGSGAIEYVYEFPASTADGSSSVCSKAWRASTLAQHAHTARGKADGGRGRLWPGHPAMPVSCAPVAAAYGGQVVDREGHRYLLVRVLCGTTNLSAHRLLPTVYCCAAQRWQAGPWWP